MGKDIRDIDLGKIRPNLRTVCSAECIEEIVFSIRRHGQLEPILICFEYDSFRILDGEKRWRACKRLGMKRIRCFIARAA